MIRLFGLAVVCVTLVVVRAAEAHEFPAPLVSVSLSSATPGGHPDLQTIFEAPTGAGFDEVRIVSPPGSGIASDADIPDGAVVGRLDAEATTNAITLPECNSYVAFTVPIREATTDLSSDSYPAYLRTLAPGPHRLRFVADVSPSPSIPILINYLFERSIRSRSRSSGRCSSAIHGIRRSSSRRVPRRRARTHCLASPPPGRRCSRLRPRCPSRKSRSSTPSPAGLTPTASATSSTSRRSLPLRQRTARRSSNRRFRLRPTQTSPRRAESV